MADKEWIPVEAVSSEEGDYVLARRWERKDLVSYAYFKKEGPWVKVFNELKEFKDKEDEEETKAQKEERSFTISISEEKIKKIVHDYDFVLHRHYGEGIQTHYDLRWKISPTEKEEFNLYGDPRELKEEQQIRARHKQFKESEESLKAWMVIEGQHLPRRVRGVKEETYIDVEDHGTLIVEARTEDKIELLIKGETLKGHFVYMSQPKAILIRTKWHILEKVEHGPQLSEYEELAKEGEPLPHKYYEWEQSGKEKNFKFVLQRHYPTGKKEPIEPGEKTEEMHKGFVVKYDPEQPEVLQEFLAGFIDRLQEADEEEQEKLMKSNFASLLEGLVLKIRDHLDLRFAMNGKNLGMTIHPPVPGGISSWDYFKEHMGETDFKTSITPKMEHPKEWLTREGVLRFPTRHREEPKQEAHYVEVARIDIIDSGEMKYGVQREDLHEYFFYGKVFKGRWVLRKLRIGKEFEHWTWQLMHPEDQKPLDPSYHKDTGYYRIDMIKAPSTEQRELIDEETHRAREERGKE